MTPVEKHREAAAELAGLVKSSSPDKGEVFRMRSLDRMRVAKADALVSAVYADDLVAALDRLIQAEKRAVR